MKKFTLLMLSIMAFTTVVNAQNFLTDGDFATTTSGNFTLGTTSYVNISIARNVWGGQNTATTDNPLPIIGVIDDAGNKCASYTRGASTPGATSPAVYLYQRLSATAGISTSKTYKLTFKAKSITANRSGFFYIRNRAATKFALRADWAYTGSETYGWCVYRSSIPTTWTEYSQTFVFSNSISGASIISSTQPPALASAVPFTSTELNDLVLCFYSNSVSGGTVYIDDVVFEEAIATPTVNAASDVTKIYFTANWTAVTGAASYKLDVSTNNTFTAILPSYNNLSVAGTSQAVTGLTESTNYYYRVRAVSNAGTITSNSETITTTTLDTWTGLTSTAETKIVIVEGRTLKIQNPGTVTVFDAMGRMVESANSSISTIALKNSGIYVVKVISDNGQAANQKIMVK